MHILYPVFLDMGTCVKADIRGIGQKWEDNVVKEHDGDTQ